MALLDSILQAEGTSKNPNSSATGTGQFINSTWLDTVRKHRPDLAEGKSDADILALRNDPAIGRQMTQAYADDNGQYLTSRGIQATPGNTYLAHFAGPAGAAAVLSNPDGAVEDTLGPAAVAANPFLRGKSNRDVAAWAASRVGDNGSESSRPSPPSDTSNNNDLTAQNGVIPGGSSPPSDATNSAPFSLAGLLGSGGVKLPGTGLSLSTGTQQQTASTTPDVNPLAMAPAPLQLAGGLQQQRKPIDYSGLLAALQQKTPLGLGG